MAKLKLKTYPFKLPRVTFGKMGGTCLINLKKRTQQQCNKMSHYSGLKLVTCLHFRKTGEENGKTSYFAKGSAFISYIVKSYFLSYRFPTSSVVEISFDSFLILKTESLKECKYFSRFPCQFFCMWIAVIQCYGKSS